MTLSVAVLTSVLEPRVEHVRSVRSNAGTAAPGMSSVGFRAEALALCEQERCDPAEPGDQRAITDREESR